MKRNETDALKIASISGICSGIASAIVFTPLDVAKTRLQVQRVPKGMEQMKPYKGIITTWKNMVQNEGILSLYKGIIPQIIAVVPNWFIFFSMYDFYNEVLIRREYFRKNASQKHLLSSVVAGGMTSIMLQPVWTIKLRLQARSERVTISQVCEEVYGSRGLKGFYRGTIASLMGLTHVAIQFPIYEWLKSHQLKKKKELSSFDVVLTSSISKLIAASAAYPHEIIRARLQDSQRIRQDNFAGIDKKNFVCYKNTRCCIKNIWKIEGWRGFYGGLSSNIVKTVPNAIVTFLVYESTKKFLKKHFEKKNFK